MKRVAPRRPLPVLNLLESPDTIGLTKHQRLRFFYPLGELLAQHNTRVGKILAGKDSKPWTAAEIRLVEKLILREVRDDGIVIGYLRVLRKLCSCWVMRQDQDCPLPRTAILLRDPWNPHSTDLVWALGNYRTWASWLASSLNEYKARNGHDPGLIDSIIPLIVSAVLYGGLWSASSLVALIRAIPHLLSRILASPDAIFVGLELPIDGSPTNEFRCWQPDPLTAVLLMRTSTNAVNELLRPSPTSTSGIASDGLVFRHLSSEFEANAHAASPNKTPTRIRTLLRSTEAIGYTQVLPFLAAYAGRRVVSPSLSLDQIRRFPENTWLFNLPVEHGGASVSEMPAANPEEVASHSIPDLPEWIDSLGSAFTGDTPAAVREKLDRLLSIPNLPPLAARLADFAARVVRLRTLSSRRRSTEVLKVRVHVLAREMYLSWGDADPAAIPDEDIEVKYKAIVSAAISRKAGNPTFKNLILGLREFHSYLHICHGKKQFKDDAFLSPKAFLDRFDVNVFTYEEYSEIMRRIELAWPGTQLSDRRQIAKILMMAGRQLGLRREEARLLSIRDVDLSGTEEVLVRPSQNHKLKSASSRRRVPAGRMLEQHERSVIDNWKTVRLKRKAQSGDFLLVTEQDEPDAISPFVFKQLNQIIAEVTGTDLSQFPAHFHHGRHSLLSFGLLRLLLPESGKIPAYLAGNRAGKWLRSGTNFKPDEIRRRRQPSRSDIFLAGSLLGHLHPSTTMRYFHFASELLRIYLDRSKLMRPTPAILEVAAGVEPGRTASWIRHPGEMGIALWLLEQKVNSRSGMQSGQIASSARPDRKALTRRIRAAMHLLALVEKPDGPVEESAVFLRMDFAEAEAIVKAAKRLQSMRSANGSLRHRFSTLNPFVPRCPHERFDLEIATKLSKRIETLCSVPETRALVQLGTSAYTNFVWQDESYPVFHHPSVDGDKARSFWDLLRALKIRQQDVILESFDPTTSWRWIRDWREVLRISSNSNFIKCTAPFGDIESSRSWLAIKPAFDSGSTTIEGQGIFGFRFAMVMGYILFGPDSQV